MKRTGAATESALLTLGVIVAAGVLLSVLAVEPATTATTVAQQQPNGGQVGDGQIATNPNDTTTRTTGRAPSSIKLDTGSGNQPGTVTVGGNVPVGQQSASCAAGRNGGSTDVGVTNSTIKLASTVVDDGPGASFLGPVRISMSAVANQVNRAGGICGRQLSLELRNDSWQASTGCQYIQNFVESDKVFALAVMPSSEGLRACDSYISGKGVPVVGSDGMLIHQYRNSWIWPVATSTISTMHIMAKNAWDRGLKNFAIVFDAKYHFGVEGAFAFDQAYKRLSGHDVPGYDSSLKSCQKRFCGIQPGQASYTSQHQAFDNDCFQQQAGGTACDFIAYLLEPDTAAAWISLGKSQSVATAGAQPLFSRSFADSQCKQFCDGMWVWTGYRPPEGSYAGLAAEAEYQNTIAQSSSSADTDNQFLEGGYIGMRLLVTALKQVGADLTRANLRAVLDGMTFDSGLSNPLTYRPGRHFANTAATAFEIGYKQSFNGFRNTTPFLTDPWVGQDIPSGE